MDEINFLHDLRVNNPPPTIAAPLKFPPVTPTALSVRL